MHLQAITSERGFAFACVIGLILLATACEGPQPIPSPDAIPADLDASWSPDGTRLVFEHSQGVSMDRAWYNPEPTGIYIINGDGSGRRLLVRGGGQPAWSPDGGSILFERGFQIFRLDLESDRITQLTFPGEFNTWHMDPAWSPDGELIAFASNEDVPSGGLYLYTMHPDGSNANRIGSAVDQTLRFGRHPAWHPDGDQLAFNLAVRDTVNDRLGSEIFTVDTTGRNRRRIAHGQEPAWSPSGEWIAYIEVDPEEYGRTYLKLVRPEDGTVRLVFADGGADGYGAPGGRPAWSPNGEWIVFSRTTEGEHTLESRLWMIHPDGSGLRQLSDPPTLLQNR